MRGHGHYRRRQSTATCGERAWTDVGTMVPITVGAKSESCAGHQDTERTVAIDTVGDGNGRTGVATATTGQLTQERREGWENTRNTDDGTTHSGRADNTAAQSRRHHMRWCAYGTGNDGRSVRAFSGNRRQGHRKEGIEGTEGCTIQREDERQ